MLRLQTLGSRFRVEVQAVGFRATPADGIVRARELNPAVELVRGVLLTLFLRKHNVAVDERTTKHTAVGGGSSGSDRQKQRDRKR